MGVVCLLGPLCLLAGAQANSAAPPQNTAEVATHDELPTFRTSTNVVMVPVVVRDVKGNSVAGLKQEDFQLFDRGKLQVISSFTVEKAEATAKAAPKTEQPKGTDMAVVDAPSSVVPPERFVAYLFDDVHSRMNDLVMARDAADRHMKKQHDVKLRAALYTTSGQNMLDFTDDGEKLHEALWKLSPHPVAQPIGHDCPELPYYWADKIRNQNDQEANGFAITLALGCLHRNPNEVGAMQEAAVAVRAEVARVIARNEHEAQIPLEVLRGTVQRMSMMPGQRSIVLVSPGFLTLIGSRDAETAIIDKAIRANVVVNALDIRGLATETPDPSKPSAEVPMGTQASILQAYVEQSEHEEFMARTDVLAEVADGTGGTFFHNSNDLDTGFDRVAAAPQYRYILGFSPVDTKADGSIHALKVSLVRNPEHFELEARRNYTAPKSISDPAEVAKEQIREALFSRDEIHEFPIELHTEYFKTSSELARLSLVAHIDLKPLKFRKLEGRNNEDLTVVAGLFDHNGNYIAGTQKGVNLRLLDGNLDRWMRSGITVPASFEVKPGAYVLRLVVRDAGGQLVSTQNGVVEIP